MRHFILVAFLLGLTHPIANAQQTTSKQLTCWETDYLLDAVQEEYKEQPVWYAPSSSKKSVYMLFENPKTKTWTLVQFDSKVACVLGTGDESRTVPLPENKGKL